VQIGIGLLKIIPGMKALLLRTIIVIASIMVPIADPSMTCAQMN